LFARATWQALAAGTKYIYLHNHMVAESSPAATQYVHTNGLDSPVALTSSTGALISRTRYEPYGLTSSGAVPTIGFTEHVSAADIGLVYMQQRYHDSVAGRFLSIDPVTTDANTGGSFNRYAYANNNPYKYVDPVGRFGVPEFIVGAAFEALVAGVVGAVTGGIGGAAAKAAMLGSISAKTAVAATSVASSAAAVTGKLATFSFAVVAPAAGSNLMRWGMVQEYLEWFGTTSASSVTVNAPAAPAPTMSVSRSPATMTAGQAFTLTWSSTNATSISRVCTVPMPPRQC
jgi:RHS repeat-associated protein